VFGSSKIALTFRPNAHTGEHYTGSISKFGGRHRLHRRRRAGLGRVSRPRPTSAPAPWRRLCGATASATVGVASAPTCWSAAWTRSFALQPLSVEGNKGLNIAAGIGAISLKAAP